MTSPEIELASKILLDGERTEGERTEGERTEGERAKLGKRKRRMIKKKCKVIKKEYKVSLGQREKEDEGRTRSGGRKGQRCWEGLCP